MTFFFGSWNEWMFVPLTNGKNMMDWSCDKWGSFNENKYNKENDIIKNETTEISWSHIEETESRTDCTYWK